MQWKKRCQRISDINKFPKLISLGLSKAVESAYALFDHGHFKANWRAYRKTNATTKQIVHCSIHGFSFVYSSWYPAFKSKTIPLGIRVAIWNEGGSSKSTGWCTQKSKNDPITFGANLNSRFLIGLWQAFCKILRDPLVKNDKRSHNIPTFYKCPSIIFTSR